jgi:hypothetical protein
MKAYVRKMYNNRYCIISGMPENHQDNTMATTEQFYTRRQAMRYAAKNGYELVILGRERMAGEAAKCAG